jgi:hypothetical protein
MGQGSCGEVKRAFRLTLVIVVEINRDNIPEKGEQKAQSGENAFHEKAGLCQLDFGFAVVFLVTLSHRQGSPFCPVCLCRHPSIRSH